MVQHQPEVTIIANIEPGFETRIRSMGGRGQPLPAAERAFFEPRFGRDFSDVLIHTDAQAEASARAVNARAYTLGRDVYFAAAEWGGTTMEGRRLLAHELAHVTQHEPDGTTLRRYSTQDCSPEVANAIIKPGDDRARKLVEKAIRVLSSVALPQELDPRVQILLRPNFRSLTPNLNTILDVYRSIEAWFDKDDYTYMCTTQRIDPDDEAAAAVVRSRTFMHPIEGVLSSIELNIRKLKDRDTNCVGRTLVHEMMHYAKNVRDPPERKGACYRECGPSNCIGGIDEKTALINPASFAGFAHALYLLSI